MASTFYIQRNIYLPLLRKSEYNRKFILKERYIYLFLGEVTIIKNL